VRTAEDGERQEVAGNVEEDDHASGHDISIVPTDGYGWMGRFY
jgi:hypothetical protein